MKPFNHRRNLQMANDYTDLDNAIIKAIEGNSEHPEVPRAGPGALNPCYDLFIGGHRH